MKWRHRVTMFKVGNSNVSRALQALFLVRELLSVLLNVPAAAGRNERIPLLKPRDCAGGGFWGSAKPACDENKENSRQLNNPNWHRHRQTETQADTEEQIRQKKGRYLLEKRSCYSLCGRNTDWEETKRFMSLTSTRYSAVLKDAVI